MIKIVIIASNFMDLDISSNNRTNFIPQFLHDSGFDVELITSDFNHHKKEHVAQQIKRDYKITLLHEHGYKKNISLKRFYSIYVYKKNLKRYLLNRDFVDIVYSFVPPHSVSHVAYKFAKKSSARFIIDVRDLWPEAFRVVIPNKMIASILFYPFKLFADSTYKKADCIIAVSDTYKERAMKVNKKAIINKTIYIGTSLSLFDKYFKLGSGLIKPDSEIWVVYAGTLGYSYDIKSLIKAMNIVKDKGYSNIKLIVLGNGPLEKDFISLADKMQINSKFFGRKPYNEMVSILSQCDIVLNPLVKGAAQSIINKHADYAASGLPVISTQETLEYKRIIDLREVGFNVDEGDYQDIAEKIILLSNDNNLREKMGKNHRKLAQEMFDRDTIYNQLIDIVKELLNE